MTLISIVFIVLGLLLFISKFFIRKKNNNYPQKRNRTLENFAVLIPARDENTAGCASVRSSSPPEEPVSSTDVEDDDV